MLIRNISLYSPLILLSLTIACNGGEFSGSSAQLKGSGQLPPEISCEDSGTCDDLTPEIIVDDPCEDETICVSAPTDPEGNPIGKNPTTPPEEPVTNVEDPVTDINDPIDPNQPNPSEEDCIVQIDKDGNEYLPEGCDPTQPPATDVGIDDPTQSDTPVQNSDNYEQEEDVVL